MLPGKYDLELYRGDTYRWQFTLWQDTARTIPVDLTDATAKSELRDRSCSDPVRATATCVVILPNTVEMRLEATQTADLLNKGVWDLQITRPGSPPDVRTVLAGSVVVTGDVTDCGTAAPGLLVRR